MPEYLYGCEVKEHPRVYTIHGVGEIVDMRCSVCGKKMHRIPQAFRWYKNPGMVLLDHLDDKYREWRGKQKRR